MAELRPDPGIVPALARRGVLLVTVRFHDQSRVLGLPRLVALRVRRRIAVVNWIYDEAHEQYGTFRLELAADDGIYSCQLWAFDRLHPSELGNRWFADRSARCWTPRVWRSLHPR